MRFTEIEYLVVGSGETYKRTVLAKDHKDNTEYFAYVISLIECITKAGAIVLSVEQTAND